MAWLRPVLAICGSLVGLYGTASGTEFAPFPPTRYVGAHGEYYVICCYASVVEQGFIGDPIRPVVYVNVKRRTGAHPLQPRQLRPKVEYNAATGDDVTFSQVSRLYRDGDEIIGTFRADYPPDRVLVCERGHGFLVLGVHGPFNDALPVIAYVSLAGEERFRRRLSELFTMEEIRAFPEEEGVTKVNWLNNATLDDEHEAVTIESPGGRVTRISLENGRRGP